MSIAMLTESLAPADCRVLQESTDGGKTLWLSGCFMQAGLKNRNNRTYPLAEMTRAVTSANAMIAENGGIWGELDHPATLAITSKNISHAITELRMDGSNVYGRAKIVPTPMGNIARTLIESGIRIGVSSRGAGNVNESGEVSDFNFVTVDIVLNPSAPGAYPTSVLESLEMSKNGSAIMTLAEQLQGDPSAQKYLIKEISKWIGSLR